MPSLDDLQRLCEQGQRELALTRYLDAEGALVHAERIARELRDFDALSRLYMPLQEARRQRRQRCGEGVVRFDLVARSSGDALDASSIVERYPQGQLIVAGWGSIQPALDVRRLAHERKLYLETFLAASFLVTGEHGNPQPAVAIVADASAMLPAPVPRGADELLALLPPHSILLSAADIAMGERRGTDQTYAQTMALWERLHTPFVHAGDATNDLHEKIDRYRRAIDVDYACEFAHQRLSRAARELARRGE